jgi:hypothetical protein
MGWAFSLYWLPIVYDIRTRIISRISDLFIPTFAEKSKLPPGATHYIAGVYVK